MGAAGKMVGVQGGRTDRQSARKARHNKVYTAKGPRDRRMRLSADTAIQFYDVQDRLGYERASEVVDWLIQKAQGSIDKLFDTSSHHFKHQTHLGAQNEIHTDCHATSMLDRSEFGEAVHLSCQDRLENLHDLADDSTNISKCIGMDSSVLFPYNHMVNYSSALENSALLSDQSILGKGQLQRIIMFNSNSNSETTNREHPLVPNSVSFLLQSPALSDKNNLSSDCTAVSGQSRANTHQSSVIQGSGMSSDEQEKYYISAVSHEYEEQSEAFNQASFLMPASSHHG